MGQAFLPSDPSSLTTETDPPAFELPPAEQALPPRPVCMLDEKQIAEFSNFVDIVEVREKLIAMNLSDR